jgi:cytolysin-activating lysine-acyltransferase
MNEAVTADERANAPLPGESALKEAFAELDRHHAGSSAKVSHAAIDHTQSQAEPPPKTVAQVLGEIVWLMTQSPRHKAMPLGDLEWLVMPAILLRQFRIFYQGEQPAGVALWALADDLVAKRIDGGDNRLSAMEWKSGASMRIIDIVAPFGGEAEMRKQLDARVAALVCTK